ncbi:NPCBM/NEW2 domain-containing protein [Rubinisphaera margarita]|uniref:NPCBM/NEW2 domain-containing protein n=1 Tax=Rubinisphaera margarita TaxID=2909586 RepID=UPI001EE98DFB|nr:NPCBM/NEW2 domain-containing protein [Rubinisphaera margarita]MCG6154634.1 NPCBM/NEW2 domain-containing protein [Rubinisphaera margarita]
MALIYRDVDLEFASASLDEVSIQTITEGVQTELPILVNQITGGEVQARVHVEVIDRPLDHLHWDGERYQWANAESIDSELDQLTQSGWYDHVFVFHGLTGDLGPSALWGGGATIRYGMAMSSLNYVKPNGQLGSHDVPGMIHEWMHGLESQYFGNLGVPKGNDPHGGDLDLHDATAFGYTAETDGRPGWSAWYGDFLTGNIRRLDDDARNSGLGFGSDAWSEGPPREDVNQVASSPLERPDLASGGSYVSDLYWAEARTDWASVERDRTTNQTPIVVNGTGFSKGVGIHSTGHLTLNLKGLGDRFQASIGVPDDVPSDDGSVVFHVVGDGQTLYQSSVITGAHAAIPIDVDVRGIRRLELRVTDAGDGNFRDHAVWGNAAVTWFDEVYASDVPWFATATDYGTIQLDLTTDRQNLVIDGYQFGKGIGIHANGTIRIPLNGRYSDFRSFIGVDDESGDVGSVVFNVSGDGQLLYTSGILTGSSSLRSFTIDVSGVQELHLEVTDAADGNISDHASWGWPVLTPVEPTGSNFPDAPFPFFQTLYTNQFGNARLDGRAVGENSHNAYQVFRQQAGPVAIQLVENTGDVEVAFYEDAGPPDSVSDTGGFVYDVILNATFASKQTHWVAVQPQGTGDANYDLRINGDSETSQVLSPVNGFASFTNQLIDDSEDYDFYELEVPSTGDWDVRVNPINFDATLLIFDSLGNAVGGTFISPINDSERQGEETWTTALSAGETYFARVDGFGTEQGTYTIVFEESEPPAVNILAISPEEPVVEGGVVQFEVRLDQPTTIPVTVHWTVGSGSLPAPRATEQADYQSVFASQELTFTPGMTSLTVNIPTVNDQIDEFDEAFGFTISNASGGTIVQAEAGAVIADDDALPGMMFNDLTVVEGDDGTIVATITGTLSRLSEKGAAVSYQTASGTATAEDDFFSRSGQVNFPVDSTNGQFTVSIVGDTEIEGDEYFTVLLTNTVHAALSTSSVTVSIQNDDVEQQPTGTPSSITGFVNGKWWVSRPDADGNYTSHVAATGPASSFRQTLQGDFNGDGFQDMALWLHNREWRVGLSDGNGSFTFTTWTTWAHEEIKEIHVGDFNDDGKDDIIGLFKIANRNRGRWWVGVSDGTRFLNRSWGDYGNYEGIETVLVGNFDGLKGEDLTVVATSGVVWMVKTSNTRFQYLNSHRWSMNNGFEFAQVGNFNGDTRDDVLAVFGTGRDRYVVVAKSIGPALGFHSGIWATWTVRDSLSGVVVGDFDGDGRDNVAGLFNGTNVWYGESNGQRFRMEHWLDWRESAGRLHELMVGDSNGDSLSDIFARASDGWWHSAESTGSSFVDRPLTEWQSPLDWRYVLVGRFASTLPAASSATVAESQWASASSSDAAREGHSAIATRWTGGSDTTTTAPLLLGEAVLQPTTLSHNQTEASEYDEFSRLDLLEYLDGIGR